MAAAPRRRVPHLGDETHELMTSPSLLRFALVRLRDGVLVLLLVTLVIFVLGHVVGNPAQIMAPVDATPEDIARLARQLGLDRPLPERMVDYFAGVLRGDFGTSLWQDRP